jgi:hypothetical protein
VSFYCFLILTVAVTKPFTSLEAILSVLANMERLARQHRMYHQSVIVDPNTPSYEADHCFSVDSNIEVFKFLRSVMGYAVSALQGDQTDSMSYVIISCLRILKINLHDFIVSNGLAKLKEDKDLDAEIEGVKALLLDFMDFASDVPLVSKIVRQEAISSFVVGFTLFSRKSADQIEFLCELLGETRESRALLLEALLIALSDWCCVANMLRDEGEVDLSVNKNPSAGAPTNIESKKFLDLLIDFVVNEAKRKASLKPSDKNDPSPSLSPATRLLLAIQRSIVGNTFGHAFLSYYSTSFFEKCTNLLDYLKDSHKALLARDEKGTCIFDSLLHDSILGSVLPSLVVSFHRKEFTKKLELSSSLLPVFIKLAQSLDAINGQLASARSANKRYLGRNHSKKEQKFVVETKHPYPYGKSQLKETITIPGASALSLSFDPRSVTSNSGSDVLQFFLTPGLDQALMKQGNPIYFSGSNFPHTNLIIPGETITLVFTSNTHPEPGSSSRWGFRCVVTELLPVSTFQPLFTQWSLDLQCMLVLLSSKCASALISGEPLSDAEKTSESWLNSGLFGGGLEEMAAEHDHEAMKWLQLFVEDIDSAPHQLWTWLKQNNAFRPKFMPPRSATPIERAERYAIAVMLKHLGLVKDAESLVQKVAAAEPLPNDTKAKFSLLARQTWQQVGQWIHQRSQIEADWQMAVMEGQGMEFFDSFKEAPQRLAELCAVKNVNFDLMEEGETIKNLYTKLKEEIEAFKASDNNTLPNPYDVISRPVIERLKLLLLKVAPSCGSVQHPSAQSANPFSEKVDPSALSRLRGSLELRTAQQVGGEFQPSSSHPLSQSMTLPVTTGSKERARERVTEKKDGEAFSQRVGELRSWINSYHRWKSWQDGGLLLQSKHKHEIHQASTPQTPVQSITSFVTVANDVLSPKDWESLLRLQHSRASSRLQGLKYLHELLKLSSFGSVLHQVLGSIGEPIKGGGHYLSGISSCGHALSAKVTNMFCSFFQTMVSIVGNTSNDSLTRQLAMGICGLAFTDYDVQLLQTANVFPTLQSILSSKSSSLSSSTDSNAMEIQDADANSDKPRQSEDERKKLEARRQSNLRASAWTAFRLLAMQCTNWSQRGESNLHDHSAVLQLQSLVFDLMCSELKRLSSGLQKQKVLERNASVSEEDDKQCYQLLSLLFVLGSASSVRLRSLSNSKNLQSLVSMLGTNISPRSQRLVLRLCRRLLPVQSPEAICELVNVLLDEMGSLLLNDKLLGTADSAAHSMDVEVYASEKQKSAGDSDPEGEKQSKKKDKTYNVYIHQWIAGEKRLLETCNKTLGPNSIPTGPGNPKLSALLAEMNSKGSILLKSGPQEQCNRLATALAEQGATVTLKVASQEPEMETKSSESLNEEQTKHWPVFWMNGDTASSMLSEYISLLRLLAREPEWRHILEQTLESNLSLVPPTVAELLKEGDKSPGKLHHILASLSILGGFQETIRVGAAVRVCGDSGDIQTGTVVSYTSGEAKIEVILATDEDPKPVHRIPLSSVLPQPECCVSSELLESLAKVSVKSLLSVVTNKKVPAASRWLFSEIKVRALSVLQEMLASPNAASLLLNDSECSEKLTLLFDLANEFKSLPNSELFFKTQLDLSHRLWNVSTTPIPSTSSWSRSPMAAILPHLPFNKKADVLPITFQVSKVPGVIYSGKDLRTVEFSAVKAGQRARGPGGFARVARDRERQSEVVITGNVPVSTDIDYYFEVTIDKADTSSIISVGLTPEVNSLSVVWDAGSYRYQANGQKRRGTGRQEPYGSYFRGSNTVGVGWNADTKSIYFTRDGVDLGSAFPAAFNPGERFLPAVGIGKGVKLRANFGQEPFRYLLKPDSELDAEVLAEKQKEAAKALAEELERQKQAAAEAYARRVEEAQNLTNMGFTLTQAMKAIEATGDSGERAVNWLLENLDKIEEEPEAPEEAEEAAENPAADEEEDKSEEMEEILDGPPELSYKEKSSAQFILDKCCAFDPVVDKGPQKPSLPPGWENHIIPEMKILMEKDGYQQYEILPFIQEMKNKLADGLEDEAVKMYRHVVGQDPNPIYRAKQAAEDTEAPLKIEQVRIGGRYSVKEFSFDLAGPKVLKHWTKDMNATIGQTGTARAIEHKSELILLGFYDSETARMEEWWYPISAISKPSRKQDPSACTLWNDSEVSLTELQKQDFEAKSKLACVYARRLLLHLLNHVPLSLDSSSPLYLVKMLSLASTEYLTTPSILASGFPLLAQRNSTFHRKSLSPPAQAQIYEGGMEVFKEKLKNLYGTLSSVEEVNSLTNVIQEACTNSLVDAMKLHKKATAMELDKTKIGTAVPFEIKGASSLLIIFDRSCAFPPNSSAELSLFSNEQCTDLIKSITDLRALTPLVVPFSKIWIRFSAKSEQSACKYKFLAVPLSASFPMARWTFEFLLNYCLDTDVDLTTLFQICLDFVYSCPAPAVTKEAIYILLSQTIYRLRRRPDKAKALAHFPFERLDKLSQEVQHLHDFETRQGSLLSSYLQSLIDFVVACKVYTAPRKELRRKHKESKKQKVVPQVAKEKAEGGAAAPATETQTEEEKEDDLTLVAIALFNALQKEGEETKDTEKESAPKDSTTPEEDKPATPGTPGGPGTPGTPGTPVAAPATPSAALDEAQEEQMLASRLFGKDLSGSDSISGSDEISVSPGGTPLGPDAGFGGYGGLGMGSLGFNPYGYDMGEEYGDDDEEALARAIAESLKTASATDASEEPAAEEPKPEEKKDTEQKKDPEEKKASEEKKDPEEKKDTEVKKDTEAKKDPEEKKEPVEEKKPEEEKPKQEDPSATQLETDFIDDMGDVDVDEEAALREALALSLQTSAEEQLAAATGKKPEEATEVAEKKEPAPVASEAQPAAGSAGPPPPPAGEGFRFSLAPSGEDSPSSFAKFFTESLRNSGSAAKPATSAPTTSTTSAAPGSTTSVPPPPPLAAAKKKKGDPSWLSELLEVTNYLEFFAVTAAHRGKSVVIDRFQRQKFVNIVKRAWEEVKKETIKDCLVVVTNIPTVEESKRTDLIWLLQDEIENHASVVPDSIFLPVDPLTKETKPWCVVELRCKNSVPTLTTKLAKTKFKLPSQFKKAKKETSEMDVEPSEAKPTTPTTSPAPEPPATATTTTTTTTTTTSTPASEGTPATTTPATPLSGSSTTRTKSDGKLVVTRFKALEDEGNPLVAEYLRFFLSLGTPESSGAAGLTPICHQMVYEIFERFAGSPDGVLSLKDFDKLQMICVGEAFGADNFAEISEMYKDKMKTIKRLERVPVTPPPNEMDVEPESTPATEQKTESTETTEKTETTTETTEKTETSEKVEVEENKSASDTEAKKPEEKEATGQPPSEDQGKEKETSKKNKYDLEDEPEEMEVEYTTVEEEVTGLSLEGFVEMWAKQCQLHNPSETWAEFFNLGYDLHMQKNHYPNFDDALAVVFPTNKVDNLQGIDIVSLDHEIVKVADSLFSNIPDLKSPLQLQPSQIVPLTNPLEYSQVDCRILRLRFEIIKQFNNLLLKALPLINLEGSGMLSKYMFFCRSLIFHSVKMEFFDTILDKTSVQSQQPKVAINRLKMADRSEKRDPKQQITTDWLLSNTSFGVAFSQLRHTNPEGFRQKKPTGTEPHFSLLVDFPGENVEGEAGPYRQFFTDISKELQQSGLLPLFVPCPNAQAKHGANRDKFVCTPSANNRLSMKMFRFVGQLMGMAIRTGVMLTLDLPSFVWKPLVGVPNSLPDLKEIDHSFYYGVMEFLHGCTKDEFDASFFDEKFQVTLSDMTHRALVPGGDKIPLTFDNKAEYLKLAEKVRLEEARHQVNAIRQGLADVVPLPLLNLCTPEDLEVSVCGRPTIDVKLLKVSASHVMS